MPRPSRLGLALAATVAASSLFVGGGLATAAPTLPPCETGQTPAADNCEQTGTGTQPDAGTGTQPDAGTGTQPDAGTGTQPDAGTGTQPDAGTGTQPDAGTGTQPDAGTQPPAKVEPGKNTPGGGYQKPSSYKPWKGDRGNPRKDRNDPPRRQGDEKDCRDFDNRDEAQDWYRSHGKPGDKDPSRLDRDKDGRVCENDDDDGDDSDPVIPPKVDVTVIINQTEDDGSEATTSGEQVKQVPEGSVDTGSAQ